MSFLIVSVGDDGNGNNPSNFYLISRGGVKVTYKAHNLVPGVRFPPAQQKFEWCR